MDKQALVDQIVAHLQRELAAATAAAQDAADGATNDEARAEDPYDTRALESSYLARGQARHAAEMQEAVAAYRALALREFAPGEPIALTALVELEQRGRSLHYFLGPRGGGISVEHDGREVLVVTPQSPLGQQLLGRGPGATVPVGPREARVVAVR